MMEGEKLVEIDHLDEHHVEHDPCQNQKCDLHEEKELEQKNLLTPQESQMKPYFVEQAVIQTLKDGSTTPQRS